MYILKEVIFITVLLIALIVFLHFILGWGVENILILLAIGAVFIAGSFWGYKQMYSENDEL